MSTLYGSLRLRPTRIGFLVAPSKLEDIRRAMQVCACLWGGVFNPIIPVSNELPAQWSDAFFPNPTGAELAKGYLNFFEPDVFVESEPGLASLAGIGGADLTYGKPRVVSLDSFFEPPGDRSRIPFGLSILDVYRERYNREFQFVRRHDRTVVVFESGSPCDAFVEAAYGSFPTQGFLSAFAKAYVDTFGPQSLPPSGNNWRRARREGLMTPLVFTRHDTRVTHDGYSEPTLFVVDPRSSTDLIELWNLRQFTPLVLPTNADWANEEPDFIREFVAANYRPLPGNLHGVMIRTTVQFGRSFSEKRAMDLAAALLNGLPAGSWSLKPWWSESGRLIVPKTIWQDPVALIFQRTLVT